MLETMQVLQSNTDRGKAGPGSEPVLLGFLSSLDSPRRLLTEHVTQQKVLGEGKKKCLTWSFHFQTQMYIFRLPRKGLRSMTGWVWCVLYTCQSALNTNKNRLSGSFVSSELTFRDLERWTDTTSSNTRQMWCAHGGAGALESSFCSFRVAQSGLAGHLWAAWYSIRSPGCAQTQTLFARILGFCCEPRWGAGLKSATVSAAGPGAFGSAVLCLGRSSPSRRAVLPV